MRAREITLRDMIALARVKADRDEPYTVYSKDSDYDVFTLDTRVHIAPTDLSHGQLPPDVAARGLNIFCHDFLLQDVVDQAFENYTDITDEDLVAGLENYLVHDAYMDYETGETMGQGGRATWGGGKWARVGRLNPDGTRKPPRS